MTVELLTEYIKFLVDQRTQLELTVFQLRKELSDTKVNEQDSTK